MIASRSTVFFSTAMLVLVFIAPAAGQLLPMVVYSDIVSSATSDVPGIAGAKFSSFDRPFSSPDGSRWIFSADTDLATTQDEVIVSGAGLTGTVVVQEGVTQVAPPSAELAGLIDGRISLTNSGDFAYGTNTDAATTGDEVIGRSFGGTFSVPAREGDPAPNILGGTIGTSNHSSYIAADGRVGYVSASLGGVPSTENSAVFFDTTVIAQEGITVPAGQAGGATNTWQLFDFENTFFANNGADYLIQGDTDAASNDDLVVRNGTVVLQEGVVIPGSGFVNPIDAAGIVETLMTADGTWFARGNNDVDEQDWLVRNGAVVVAGGDTVPGGLAGEVFDDAIFSDTFFLMTGNNVGDYVYGGVTDAANTDANAVLIFNNASVLLREGDSVDLNGNGLADDDAFLSVFNNDDSFLTDDLKYYFTADLRDSLGASIGQAFMVVSVPEPATLTGFAAIASLLLLRRLAGCE